MRTIVTNENLDGVLAALSEQNLICLDCETTGLSSFHNSKMFSLAMSTDEQSYYFDFTKNLVPSDLLPLLQQIKPERIWVGHNIKFDMHFLAKAGVLPQTGHFYDTKVLARIFENKHQPWLPGGGYSLDACSKRWLDQVKDDKPKAWMDENFAYEMNEKGQKNYFFDLVPFEIISEYAMIDTEVTLKLYNYLMSRMYDTQMVKVESEITKILFHVEQRGLLIDVPYVEKARAHELEVLRSINKSLPDDFVDSAKYLSPLLVAEGFNVPKTEKGNDQVTDQVLKQKESELASNVLKLRESGKRLNTYFDNYLTLIDRDNVLHPTLDAAGTATGRMASYSPNFQNIPTDDSSEFPVRRSIIARPGYKLASIDFKAMEFKMACYYAGETELLEKINSGYDPHQATADLTGLTRKQAKTLSFAVIYGAGLKKIAETIGCSEVEAKKFKLQYFQALPGIAGLLQGVKKKAEYQGYISTWTNRKLMMEDANSAYKMPNHLIQGGCADLMKIALVNMQPVLDAIGAKLILVVHDEAVLEVPEERLSELPQIAKVMSEANPNMPMACSIEVGDNFSDMVPYE